VDVTGVGETVVTTQGPTIGREIEEEHEGCFHELGGCDLDARVALMYSKTAEERLIGTRTRLCTCRV